MSPSLPSYCEGGQLIHRPDLDGSLQVVTVALKKLAVSVVRGDSVLQLLSFAIGITSCDPSTFRHVCRCICVGKWKLSRGVRVSMRGTPSMSLETVSLSPTLSPIG